MQFLAAAAGAKLRAMRKALVLLFLVSGAARADTVLTKDGQRHVGRIIDRTETGYVFREDSGETHVLDFAQVDDVQRSGVTSAPPSDAPIALPPVQLAPQMASPQVALMIQLQKLREERLEQTVFWPITGLVVGTVLTVVGINMANNYYEPKTYRDEGAGGATIGVVILAPSAILFLIREYRLGVLGQQIRELEKQAAQMGIALPRD